MHAVSTLEPDPSTARTANLLGALAGAVVERSQAPLRDHPNQNASSVAALKLVAEAPGCSNLMLSRALGLSHPATVRLVDKLEAAGLVESRPGADRRAVALHVTAPGRRRLRGLLDERGRALQGLVDGLPAEQRSHLDRIAETLLESLTATPLAGAHLCRLCDEQACPPGRCPGSCAPPPHRRADVRTSRHDLDVVCLCYLDACRREVSRRRVPSTRSADPALAAPEGVEKPSRVVHNPRRNPPICSTS
jgi:DNA-binding MarR family transcriptional regulator